MPRFPIQTPATDAIATPNQATPWTTVAPTTPGCTITPCYFFNTGLSRAQPALGGIQGIVSTGNGNYQALQMDFTQRVSHGFRYKFSFTWSKDIDDVSGVDSALSPCGSQQVEIIALNSLDKGLSCYDLRRAVAANYTYDIPFNQFIHGHKRLVEGWQVGSIVTLQDGTPYSPLLGFNAARDLARNNSQRPNVVSGNITLPNGQTFNCNSNPTQGGVNQYYQPLCFTPPPAGFYGNLGRNTAIGPGIATLDVSLVKATAINERMNLIFRAQAFNVGNHANFASPAAGLFNSNGTYQPTDGQITVVRTSPRQIQFGLKLVF